MVGPRPDQDHVSDSGRGQNESPVSLFERRFTQAIISTVTINFISAKMIKMTWDCPDSGPQSGKIPEPTNSDQNDQK